MNVFSNIRLVLMFLFVGMITFFIACKSDVSMEPKEIDLSLLRRNEIVMKGAFDTLSTMLSSQALNIARKGSANKSEFINMVNEIGLNGLNESLRAGRRRGDVSLGDITFSLMDESSTEELETSLLRILANPTDDPYESYINQLQEIIKSERGVIDEIRLVDNWNGDEGSNEAAADDLTITFSGLEFAAGKALDINDRIGGSYSDYEVQVDDLIKENKLPLVFKPLFLPAFSSSGDFDRNGPIDGSDFLEWIDEEVNQILSDPLDKEQIDRINLIGYCASLQLLLTDEFKNDDQDIAALLLFRARYIATLMFIGNMVWNDI